MVGIGGYVKALREATGAGQGKLADRAGLPRPYMSQLEAGKVGLPGADIRRRLASALGISHLDLLIAAGELLSEEVVDAGKAGVVMMNMDDPAAVLADRLRRMHLTERDLFLLEGMLDAFDRRPQEEG